MKRWLIASLFASIFLQRFAVPLGQFGIGINLAFTLVAFVALGWRGALTIDPARAIFACAFVASAWLSFTLNTAEASLSSVAFVMAIYLPFALALRDPGDAFETCLAAFQTMVLVCAVAGILQFLAQLVVPAQYLFTFRGLLPASILLGGISEFQPLYWGASLYRSNGFFFIEPSTCSQYMALAITFELLFFGATLRLPLYAVSLALTYSGTGLVLLVVMLPCVLLYRRAFKAMGLVAILLVMAVALGDLWNMDALLGRTTEFGEEGSSATARYNAPVWLVVETLMARPGDVLFGIGPGSYLAHAMSLSHETHDPVWAKLPFEYGLVGTTLFLLLYGTAVFTRVPSRWVSVSLTIGFLTFGGMMLDARLHVLLMLFCVLPKTPLLQPAAIRTGQAGFAPGLAPVRAEATP